MLNIISLYCDWRLYFSIYICIGRALSSPKTPHQVLKIRNPKTTNLDIDDKYTRRLCWLDHFHFPASCSIFTPGHYPEESTILGENPLKELTPAVRYQTICTKIKVSPPLLLQPPCAPPAGIPLSFWCCWRKVKGTSFLERFLVSSPPPILHSLYSDATHLISPVHKDWTFKVWNLNPFHGLAIQRLRVATCHFHTEGDVLPPLVMM